MGLRPHDLVKIMGVEDLVPGQPFPHWVDDSLQRAPFVVVRRALNQHECVPVGIRGRGRGQRFAAWLPANKVVEIVTPYSLATPLNWKAAYRTYAPETIRSLQLITPLMQQAGYKWGPTGSAGFELATGIATINDSSDLDLLIDLPEFISVQSAALLLNKLKEMATVCLDIQMNTPTGGVALKEYIKSEDVLIKTFTGPVVQPIHSLWN